MNSRKMQQMMKRMGIQQQEIPATEVIIKTPDKQIIISSPQVSRVNMMGQKTFQITGEETEKSLSSEPEIDQDDLKTVMDQTDVDEKTAKTTLEKNKGDIAKTILELQK